jgi:tetratricopeptide (TPR) repeat protein
MSDQYPKLKAKMDKVIAAINQQSFDDALKQLRPIIKELEKLPQQSPILELTFEAHIKLGIILTQIGQLEEGQQVLKKVLADIRKIAGAESAIQQAQHYLALNYAATGDFASAILLSRHNLELIKQLGEPETSHQYVFENHLLAQYLVDVDQLDEALERSEFNLKAIEKELGTDNPDWLMALDFIASIQQLQANWVAAETTCRRVYEVFNRSFGPKHPDTFTAYHNLARVIQEQGRPKEYIPMFKSIYDFYLDTIGIEELETILAAYTYADALEKIGQTNESLPLFEQVLEFREVNSGAFHPDTLEVIQRLGTIYETLGMEKELEDLSTRFWNQNAPKE